MSDLQNTEHSKDINNNECSQEDDQSIDSILAQNVDFLGNHHFNMSLTGNEEPLPTQRIVNEEEREMHPAVGKELVGDILNISDTHLQPDDTVEGQEVPMQEEQQLQEAPIARDQGYQPSNHPVKVCLGQQCEIQTDRQNHNDEIQHRGRDHETTTNHDYQLAAEQLYGRQDTKT